MPRYLKDKAGRFTGSVAGSKKNIPTAVSASRGPVEEAASQQGFDYALLYTQFACVEAQRYEDAHQIATQCGDVIRRMNRTAMRQGADFKWKVLTLRRSDWGGNYDGFPVGPLESVLVYGLNVDYSYSGKSHAVGCKHHEEVGFYTQRIPLRIFLEKHAEMKARNRYDEGPCSKCGGVSIPPLNEEQLKYVELVREVNDSIDYGGPLPESINEYPELKKWARQEIRFVRESRGKRYA